MAIFGDVGKFLGLGTTKQTLQGAVRGAVQGAFMGNPIAGASAGALGARSQQGQATAVAVPAAPPAETAFSGETVGVQRAGVNTFMQPAAYSPQIAPAVLRGVDPMRAGRITGQTVSLPAIISGGNAVTRGVGMLLGLGGTAAAIAPIIIDPVTGQEKKLRVTRRLRSKVKEAVEMFGVEAVAEQMGTDVEVIFYILTKKMRNDGPYVTKAAVRKTRATVRKMKNLCDMYDDLRPPARRRAPARKNMSTRITTVK